MSITVTFRKAKEGDREVYDWKPYGINGLRPTVVTVQGVDRYEKRKAQIVLIMEGEKVVWQNGSRGIADLIRAQHRLWEALGKGLDDPEGRKKWRRKQDEEMQEFWATLRSEE